MVDIVKYIGFLLTPSGGTAGAPIGHLRRTLPAALAALSLGLSANVAHAELPWLPPARSFTTAINISYDQYDQFLVPGDTKYTLPGEIEQLDIAVLAQYSVTKELSLQLTLPVSYSRREFSYLETDGFGMITNVGTGPNGEVRDVDSQTSLGDVLLQAKYLLLDEPVSVGVKSALKIPGTYDENQPNAPGDGQFDLAGGILVGKRIALPVSLYGGIDASYVGRFGAPADQFNLTVEAGIFPLKWLLVRAVYDKVIQFGGEDLLFFGFDNNFPGLDEDYDMLGGGLGFRPTASLDIFANVFKTLAGANTSDSLIFTVGVSKTF